jgi:hypothetical protein
MPAEVIALGLGILALGALVALRAPPPRLSESAWRCAGAAATPAALLWMVSLTVVARPTAFATAMLSGAACCVVLWLLRAPRALPPPADGGWGGGRGDEPPAGRPRGGEGIEWEAFERAAYEAWRRSRAVAGCDTGRSHGC